MDEEMKCVTNAHISVMRPSWQDTPWPNGVLHEHGVRRFAWQILLHRGPSVESNSAIHARHSSAGSAALNPVQEDDTADEKQIRTATVNKYRSAGRCPVSMMAPSGLECDQGYCC